MAVVVLFAIVTLATAFPSQREQDPGTALPATAKNVLTYNEGEFMHSFGHYFNGSYKVHDVLKELQANQTLGLKYTPKGRRKRSSIPTLPSYGGAGGGGAGGGGDCTYYASRLYGGTGGSVFRDTYTSTITGMTVYAAGIIDSIQIVYSSSNSYSSDQGWTATKHGGTGGSRNIIYFSQTESIVAVVGSYGASKWCSNCVMELGFVTADSSSGEQLLYGPYGCGCSKGEMLIFVGNVVGFFGRSGNYLDAIGCYYAEY